MSVATPAWPTPAETVADSACLAAAPRRPPSPALEASVLKAITAGLFDSDDDGDDVVDTQASKRRRRRAARRSVTATRSDSSSLSDASAATPCAAALRGAPPSPVCSELTSAPPPPSPSPPAAPLHARAASAPAPAAALAAPAPKRLKSLRGDFWARDPAAAAAVVDDPDALLAPPGDAPPTPRSLPSVSLAGLLPDQVAAALAAPTRAGRGPLGLVLDTAALVAELNRGRRF